MSFVPAPNRILRHNEAQYHAQGGLYNSRMLLSRKDQPGPYRADTNSTVV